MSWRFEDIIAFVRVMETGGITAAGERMNLSKSVISRRITDLETALGVELFRRSTREMNPTEVGEAYYQRVAPLLHEIGDTLEGLSATGSPTLRGQLRVTMPLSFGVMYLGSTVAFFAREHPELELAVDYADRWSDLVREGYHLGIGVERPPTDGIVSRRLCVSPRVICCSPAYASRHGVPKNAAELEEHHSVGYAHIEADRWWLMKDGRTGRPSMPSRRRILANNGEAVRDLVMAGLGIAPLPLFLVARQLRAGTLMTLLDEPGLSPVAIAASYPERYGSSAKVMAFVDFLLEFFKPPYPWERPEEGILTTAGKPSGS